MNQKTQLVKTWGENIQRAVNAGKFGKSKQRLAIGPVTGPRMGGLDIVAREDPAGLKKAFNEQDGLNLAATVPWIFAEGHVNIFSHGRLIRVEAPWPPQLAETNIPLTSVLRTVDKHVVDGWIAGWNDMGQVIIPNFHLEPHWIFSGATGSGKSVAMVSAVAQMALASQGRTKFVLIDGKAGESLSAISSLPNLIGPAAYDIESITSGLNWVIMEMTNRYAVLRTLDNLAREKWDKETSRIVVVIDEVQTITQYPNLNNIIVTLLQQGRAAKINLLISTQHPTAAVLGSSTMKTNASGRITLKLNSADASRTAIGMSEPNAANLLGKGDCYVTASGSFARVQIAYLSREELTQIPRHRPDLEEWPEGESESVSFEGAPASGWTSKAMAIALLAARDGVGRPTLKKRLEEAGEGKIGMQKLYSLLNYSREVIDTMQSLREDNGTEL